MSTSSFALVVLTVCTLLTPSESQYKKVSDQEPLNWADANAYCSDYFGGNGRLATWSSSSEYNTIATLHFIVNPNTGTWVGLTDDWEDGKWKFVGDDTSYCGPGGGGGCIVIGGKQLPQWELQNSKSCAEIRGDGWSVAVTLKSEYCDRERPFICESMDGELVVIEGDAQPMLPQSQPHQQPQPEVFAGPLMMLAVLSLLLNIILLFIICRRKVRKSTAYQKVEMVLSSEVDEE